jgi:hypothetical protein
VTFRNLNANKTVWGSMILHVDMWYMRDFVFHFIFHFIVYFLFLATF